MHPFSRRAPLVAAFAIAAASFSGVPAQAATYTPVPNPPTLTTQDAKTRHAKAGPSIVRHTRTAREPVTAICGPPYVLGDPNLGPKYLPRTSWLGSILRGYVRYGGLPPTTFLDRYRTVDGWRYPQDFGFAHAGGYSNAKALISTVTLAKGLKLDRFGGENGAFLAPYGTPFVKRALPPSSLNTFSGDPQHLCSYHAYQVEIPFQVDAGPAASAFQQRGVGQQYHTLVKYIEGSVGNDKGELPISWLIDHGYLKRLN
ncbi:TNT domain-containing protein [Nonomuraea sp. NPDC048916]|uniref:TNT domain-containing protein n=1 Tax=Nonomuraea sp. NPDC048916 TaxID=3154232 RepID=UPI0033DC573E